MRKGSELRGARVAPRMQDRRQSVQVIVPKGILIAWAPIRHTPGPVRVMRKCSMVEQGRFPDAQCWAARHRPPIPGYYLCCGHVACGHVAVAPSRHEGEDEHSIGQVHVQRRRMDSHSIARNILEPKTIITNRSAGGDRNLQYLQSHMASRTIRGRQATRRARRCHCHVSFLQRPRSCKASRL